MELKEGMYVRTYQGIIGKIKHFNNDRKTNFNTENNNWITIDGVKKASHNIIDLIEVGDYVNGDYVNYVKDGKIHIENYNIDADEIEDIVTHEQFESVSYKVGE